MHSKVKLPQEFLNLVESTMPDHLNLDDFVSACQRPLRRSIRVNTLKVTVQDFLNLANSKGWQLHPIPWCGCGFWIDRDDESVPLGNTSEHLSGLFYIQEASSMLPITALMQDNQGLDLVLDMAAAPGSKTTQIAAFMQNKGGLVANEYSASRVKVLSANIQRCGVHNTALTNFDGCVFGGWLPETFDTVLLDAPCSGEGTVRKDADAMLNWCLESIAQISDTQRDLIESAFYALKLGGTLVYSTCTLNTQENQAVCHHLKNTFGDAVEFTSLAGLFEHSDEALTEDGFLHIYPQVFDSEGFFVAKIKKLQSVTPPTVNKRLGKFPFEKADPKLLDILTNELKATLNIDLPDHKEVWIRDKEVWLFPTALTPLIGQMRFSRIGIKLAETIKSKKPSAPQFRWQHETVMSLASSTSSTMVELTIEQAREWFMGRDIRIEEPSTLDSHGNIAERKGEVIVSFNQQPIGLGKWVANRIKNGLPRDLVRNNNLF